MLQEGQYASKEEAKAGIASEVENFYKTNYAELATAKAAEIKAAGAALGDIYSWNVFPKMKVTWGTHINNLGHSDEAPGCFRCHDKKHATADGAAHRRQVQHLPRRAGRRGRGSRDPEDAAALSPKRAWRTARRGREPERPQRALFHLRRGHARRAAMIAP